MVGRLAIRKTGVNKMREQLRRRYAEEVADILRDLVDRKWEEEELPFVVGHELRSSDLTRLTEELTELASHPRKYREILYWLGLLGH